jgi:hypothetical protein
MPADGILAADVFDGMSARSISGNWKKDTTI